ncbi:hypothetical protein L53_03705 [Hyphomonas sp. L-53-1-40]|nr:hypothetical protein L53_03705 [Hyphomonas sp. L-53-1-40]
MRARQSHTHHLAFLAALFVFVQALALGHAAAHADQPHDHYGVTCDLAAVAHVQTVLPDVPTSPFVLLIGTTVTEPQFSQPIWIRPPGRAPPPRSPPSSQQ